MNRSRNNLPVNDRLPGPAGPRVVQRSQNHLTCLVFKRRLRETDQGGPGESESGANRFLNVADEIRNLYRRSIRQDFPSYTGNNVEKRPRASLTFQRLNV